VTLGSPVSPSFNCGGESSVTISPRSVPATPALKDPPFKLVEEEGEGEGGGGGRGQFGGGSWELGVGEGGRGRGGGGGSLERGAGSWELGVWRSSEGELGGGRGEGEGEGGGGKEVLSHLSCMALEALISLLRTTRCTCLANLVRYTASSAAVSPLPPRPAPGP